MNDITQPLRLARGSHEAGSGKGCAMNVISWENGDSIITDYPACSARPLARLVQGVNDTICIHTDTGMLCPACSQIVLDLGHATVGTAGATQEQEAAWCAELLDSPHWGIARFARGARALWAARTCADLYRRRAGGDEPSHANWRAVASVAYAAACTSDVAYAAAAYAVAYAAAAAASADAAAFASSAAAAASVYAARAYAPSGVSSHLEHARAAIGAWHRICGTLPQPVTGPAVRLAVSKMLATA